MSELTEEQKEILDKALLLRRKRLDKISDAKKIVEIKKGIPAEEYQRRLLAEIDKDSSDAKSRIQSRLDRNIAGWRKKVGERFRDATTDSPYILERIARLKKGDTHRTSLVLAGSLGVGKAQPVTEPVLTPIGYVEMGDLIIGDDVVGSDGKPTTITAIYPQGIRPVYKISFSDGSFTYCDQDHLWTVIPKDDDDKNSMTLTTLELIESGFVGSNREKKYRIPITKPVEFDTTGLSLDIEPYLLGLLLGNSYLWKTQLRIPSNNQKVVDYATNALIGGGYLRQSNVESGDYAIYRLSEVSKNPLRESLEDYNLLNRGSFTKFIPNVYSMASVDDRLSLLQGLMDSNGYIAPNSAHLVQFTTISPQLAEDITDLVNSLGGVLQRSTKFPSGDNYLAITLTINMDKSMNPFRLAPAFDTWESDSENPPVRLIANIEYSHQEESRCISVDAEDNLYLTRNYIVTHNTWIAYSYLNMLVREGIMSPANMVASTETSTLVRIATGGYNRSDMFRELKNPLHKVYFMDDVGQAHFSSDSSRHEVWYELIDHIYSNDLTLIMTTNKTFQESDGSLRTEHLGRWLGAAAYDRMKYIMGPTGLIVPGDTNRRPQVFKERDQHTLIESAPAQDV